jgi:hypothetical protein
MLTLIIKEFEEKVKEITSKICNFLIQGDLLGFEEYLYKAITELYKNLVFAFMMEAAKSKELEDIARSIAQKKGMGEVRKEEVDIQLKTGDTIRIFSWFAVKSKSKRKKKRGPNGSGCHLLLHYWGCINRATPAYYSLVTQLSVLCPSFEIVVRVLEHQQIKATYKRVRDIAYAVGSKCMSNRIQASLKPGETLEGKRVIISVDGGRTRIRKENPGKNKSKKSKGKRTPFDTPWREPKLFVIHVLDEKGKVSKAELPVYDLVIGEQKADECFELLSQYLWELQVEKAKEVLFIADGAEWIWNRAKNTLVNLGVPEEIIHEAIDFYHAVEHLSTLVQLIYPQSWKKKEREQLFHALKKSLKNGKVRRIISNVKSMARNHHKRRDILDALKYFQKHEHRMQYPTLKAHNLPCGSGIVESAVRRLINLRYKSPSTFWKEEHVEKLIFLRGLFLANRWKYAMTFLARQNSGSISYLARDAA